MIFSYKLLLSWPDVDLKEHYIVYACPGGMQSAMERFKSEGFIVQPSNILNVKLDRTSSNPKTFIGEYMVHIQNGQLVPPIATLIPSHAEQDTVEIVFESVTVAANAVKRLLDLKFESKLHSVSFVDDVYDVLLY